MKNDPNNQENKKIKSILFHIKPVTMLTLLKDGDELNISRLASESSSTYVYAHRTVKAFERFGLVITRLEGKKRMVRLTNKGQSIAIFLEELLRKIESTTNLS